MPVITVDWWKGNDRAQRAELVAELTETVAKVANCPHDAVTVIVRDVEPSHWGKGGALADTLVGPGSDGGAE
ncbi:4-oxalocrotonate tautomerase family protein [Streptomyces sp. NPDC086023]|uniref:tautomerase family protein n=1 Tax=unclassified Streptomyces TaxID=2593676 RepID=UPI0037D190C2